MYVHSSSRFYAQVSVHLANFPSADPGDVDVRLVPISSAAEGSGLGPAAEVLDASAGGSLISGGWARVRFTVPAVDVEYLGDQVILRPCFSMCIIFYVHPPPVLFRGGS